MNRTGFADIDTALDDFSRLQFVIQQAINGLATATIVQVKAVDAGTVDVQPMVSQIDGKNTGVAHSTIHGMPYFALQGGNSAVLVTPKAGDIGLAVFCHSDISSVKASKAPALPASRRRYSWADGIYLGGLPLLNAAPTQFIRLDDSGIEITAGPGLPVTINAPGGAIVNGDATVNGNATVDGDVSASGNLNVTGNGTFGGTISGSF